jgi:hypothetical protein
MQVVSIGGPRKRSAVEWAKKDRVGKRRGEEEVELKERVVGSLVVTEDAKMCRAWRRVIKFVKSRDRPLNGN